MRHVKLVEWEKQLTRLFNEVDDYLEEKYGQLFTLHPARAPRGSTATKAHDGLFNVGAAFTAGIGSAYGPGYVVEVNFVTLENVPVQLKAMVDEEVLNLVKRKLPVYFPDRKLEIIRDGNVYKIFGDLKLGNV